MKEGPSAWKERISESSAGSIDLLLEKNPELELTSLADTVEGRTRIFLLASPKEIVPPVSLTKTILEYQSKEVINERGGNMFRSDCVFVAGAASKALQQKLPELGFEVISTKKNYEGRVVPLFKEQGFGHHAINMIEQNDGSYLAFDLSAHYTMDAEQGRYDVFGVMSDSREKLKKYLKDLSGSPWD